MTNRLSLELASLLKQSEYVGEEKFDHLKKFLFVSKLAADKSG